MDDDSAQPPAAALGPGVPDPAVPSVEVREVAVDGDGTLEADAEPSLGSPARGAESQGAPRPSRGFLCDHPHNIFLIAGLPHYTNRCKCHVRG